MEAAPPCRCRSNTNVMALNAQRNLPVNGRKLSVALEQLSSGLCINRAADDAPGLAINKKMRAQVRGMQHGLRNAQDGVSMIQTAEGALSETHAILQRMRELTVQASSTSLSISDRQAVGEELLTLRAEVDNIATRARFNGLNLLTGALSVTAAGTITTTTGTRSRRRWTRAGSTPPTPSRSPARRLAHDPERHEEHQPGGDRRRLHGGWPAAGAQPQRARHQGHGHARDVQQRDHRREDGGHGHEPAEGRDAHGVRLGERDLPGGLRDDRLGRGELLRSALVGAGERRGPVPEPARDRQQRDDRGRLLLLAPGAVARS
ncbi:MAG: hypothetical protein FJZ92_08270 [Chloroflexi bacterium]|nr:hypothetical protein [Chloroflexota bacterium]